MPQSKFVRAVNTTNGQEQIVPRHSLEDGSPFPNFKPVDDAPAVDDEKQPATSTGAPTTATTSGASAARKKGK